MKLISIKENVYFVHFHLTITKRSSQYIEEYIVPSCPDPNMLTFREQCGAISWRIKKNMSYFKLLIIFNHPTSEILGDFNVYNNGRRGPTTTDPQGRAARSFAVGKDFTNIIHEPAFFPCISGFSCNLLELFLTWPRRYFGLYFRWCANISGDCDELREFFFFWSVLCFSSINSSVICYRGNSNWHRIRPKFHPKKKTSQSPTLGFSSLRWLHGGKNVCSS